MPPGSPQREASAAVCTDGNGWVVFDGMLALFYGMPMLYILANPGEFEETANVQASTGALAHGGMTAISISPFREESRREAQLEANIRQDARLVRPGGVLR